MEEEEDTYCRFGTPLEPLDEDEIPSKKPIAVEDQIVTDANGKRRFHGAFTGGFSAGFWNTVGSLEGWKPQSFKSSRSEKADKMKQRAIDFMDDEDLSEFGIAPQRVQTTDDFKSKDAPGTSGEQIRKRKLQQSTGPIPGVPVLHQLLQPAKENIAIRLLKKMGWKEGQGVGARQTHKEKKLAAQRNARERYVMKMYGCDMGPMQTDLAEDEETESDMSDDEITFAPDDFEPFVCSIKTNTFGLGYQGLSRDPVLKKQQHVNLFGDAFEMVGKNNKKLSIRGQAFGVGALEEDDEDIYARDDMTKYDFSLDNSKKLKSKEGAKRPEEHGVLEGFASAQNASTYTKKVFVVTLPPNYIPRNWTVRKSRFEPIDGNRAALIRKQDEHKMKGLGRHDLDPEQRGQLLGETSSNVPTTSTESEKHTHEPDKATKKTYLERINEKYKSQESAAKTKFMEKLTANVDKFAKGEVLNDDKSTSHAEKPLSQLEEDTKRENEKVLAEAKNITKALGAPSTTFKPFAANEAKQERYEKFVEENLKDDDAITKFLGTIQPLSMTEWDREMEKKEFIQARNMYRPLKGLMSDRFISEATVVADREETKPVQITEKKIKIIRTKTMWKPSSQLCKRFNIADPLAGLIEEKKEKKKPRFSVFDYLEMSVNRKDNFVTPVIIPTKAERPKPIVLQTEEASTSNAPKLDVVPNTRLSTKELFANEVKSSRIEWNRVTENKPSTSDSNSSAPAVRKTSNRAKTELEKKVEEMKNKHPSEKKDLFKAIFDSDSEDEETDKKDDAKEMSGENFVDAAKIIGIEAHKDIFASIKQSAAEINVLRNTSPPRGIFANLFTKKVAEAPTTEARVQESTVNAVGESSKTSVPEDTVNSGGKVDASTKIVFKSRNERELPDEQDIYGPKIPNALHATTPAVTSPPLISTGQDKSDVDKLDQKLLKLLKKSKKEGKVVEEWIEKPSDDVNKKKKRKDKDRDKKKKSKKEKKPKKEKKRHKNKK